MTEEGSEKDKERYISISRMHLIEYQGKVLKIINNPDSWIVKYDSALCGAVTDVNQSIAKLEQLIKGIDTTQASR